MLISDEQISHIAAHQPAAKPQDSLMRAAVAVILRDGPRGTEFLMMQRASHENDPWSGQMAFPGGKIEPDDQSAKDAAIRETQEEVGLQLYDTDFIGRLDDVYGLKVDDKFSVHVACFVFKPEGDISLIANYEVADMVWLPMSHLLEKDNAYDFYHPHDTSIKMPAVRINLEKEQILWGLSLRLLSTLFELIDVEMTVFSKQDNASMNELEKRVFKVEKKTLSKKLSATN